MAASSGFGASNCICGTSSYRSPWYDDCSMSQRLETLRSLIEQDPGNSRFRYMLAMETANSGDLASASIVFEQVVTQDPDYSAAYFHGGQTLEKQGRLDEARALYQRGIEATTRTGDSHTRSELQGALSQLGF